MAQRRRKAEEGRDKGKDGEEEGEVLRDPPAFVQAPFEEHLRASLVGAGVKVVCFDLEVTGLLLDDEIVQVGAKAWASSFDQYVVPATRDMHPEAAEKTRLAVDLDDDGERRLLDASTGSELPAVSEREALLNFVEYLRSEAKGTPGLVLVSHGARLLDIPVLLTALERNRLTDDFFQIVLGMCDTIAIVRDRHGERFPKRSLTCIYEQLTGKSRRDTHRALVDATDLYTVLQLLFRQPKDELSFDNDDLWFSTWTPGCLTKFVAWRQFWDGKREDSLTGAFAPLDTRLHRTVVRNLVLAGCSKGWLKAEYRRLGRATFRRLFRARLQAVKALHENFLTDTASLSASSVTTFVCNKLRSFA